MYDRHYGYWHSCEGNGGHDESEQYVCTFMNVCFYACVGDLLILKVVVVFFFYHFSIKNSIWPAAAYNTLHEYFVLHV